MRRASLRKCEEVRIQGMQQMSEMRRREIGETRGDEDGERRKESWTLCVKWRL